MANVPVSSVLSGFYGRRLLKLVLIFAFVVFCFSGSFSFASSSGDEHASKGWVKTDTYRVFNFAVLAIGLFLVARNPVKSSLSKRVDEIRNELEGLEGRKKEVEAELAKSDERLAELEKEAKALLDEYVKQGENAKVEILAEAKISAEKLREQAEKNVEDEFLKAKLRLRREIVEKAIIEAEKIIREQITSGDQEKLVDEYLEKVVA